MKKLIWLSLLLAGCAAGNSYQVICKDSPAPPNYPKPLISCPCDGSPLMVEKRTFWGKRSYRVWDCTGGHRVYLWERIKTQK